MIRSLKTTFSALAVFTLFVISGAQGANRDVCATGCPYATIQAAINAAQNGDMVRVAQGLYLENIALTAGLALTIQGGWDPAFTTRANDPGLTLINGRGLGSVFLIQPASNQSISLTLDGLTLTNGLAASGGGIYAYAYTNSTATVDMGITLNLSNLRIEGNHASSNGGGIHANAYTYSNTAGAGIHINADNIRIEGNHAGRSGGGLYANAYTSSDTTRAVINTTMTNSRIADNQACENGGGLYFYAISDINRTSKSALRFALSGNAINGNQAVYGGGVYGALNNSDSRYQDAPSWVEGNEINGNRAMYNSGLYLRVHNSPSTGLNLRNNVISGNFSARGETVQLETKLSDYNIAFANNTVTHNTGRGIFQAFAGGDGGQPDNLVVNLYNNLFYGNSLQDTLPEINLDNYSDGNMVVNVGSNTLTSAQAFVTIHDMGGNSVTDPLIGDDFHLRSGSPAIDSADPGFAPAADKNGHARAGNPDRGAYEYLGSDHQALMPAPSGRFEVEYPSPRQPVVASDAAAARPLAVYVDGAKTAHFNLNLPRFAAPVDVYLGLYIPAVDPYNVYQITSDWRLDASSTPLPWRSGETAAVQSNLFGDVDLSSGWPRFEGFMYLIITPQGASPYGQRYYEYRTSFYLD